MGTELATIPHIDLRAADAPQLGEAATRLQARLTTPRRPIYLESYRPTGHARNAVYAAGVYLVGVEMWAALRALGVTGALGPLALLVAAIALKVTVQEAWKSLNGEPSAWWQSVGLLAAATWAAVVIGMGPVWFVLAGTAEINGRIGYAQFANADYTMQGYIAMSPLWAVAWLIWAATGAAFIGVLPYTATMWWEQIFIGGWNLRINEQARYSGATAAEAAPPPPPLDNILD